MRLPEDKRTCFFLKQIDQLFFRLRSRKNSAAPSAATPSATTYTQLPVDA